MIDNNIDDIPEHLTKGELHAGILGSRLAQDVEDNNLDEIEEELEPDYVEDDCFDDEEVDGTDEAGDDSLAGEENYE